MDDSLLEKIRENRDAILLSEIGAYLHLLGRFSVDFIESQAIDRTSDFDYKQICEDNTFFENTGLENTLTSASWKSRLNSFSAKDRRELSSNKVNDFSDFIRKHTWGDNPRGLCRILTDAHGIVSAIDKILTTGEKKCKQRKDYTFRATAFGYEREIELTKNPNLKQELLKELNRHLKKINREKFDNGRYDMYRGFVDLIEKYYPKTIGETRRPINEVSLFDYAYPIASLMKSNLCKILLEGWQDPRGKSEWCILKINIDVVELLSKGLKLGDILGYENEINGIFKKVKELLEYSYPLGNKIYIDSTGIYFTLPALSEPNLEKLKKEIEKKIKEYDTLDFNLQLEITEKSRSLTLLARGLQEARNNIAFHNVGDSSFFSISANSGKEICSVCRIRPVPQNEEICRVCKERRVRRGKEWLKNKKETIWLDEIADHNDRVALIVGKFNINDWLCGDLLKTLRARIFEYWETENKKICKELSISSIKDLKNEFSSLFTSPLSDAQKQLCKSFIRKKVSKVEEDFWEPVAERDATGKAIYVQDSPERGRYLVELFFTKHPSIARLGRIWKTTDDFIHHTIFNILDHYEYATNTTDSEIRNKRLELELELEIQNTFPLDRGSAYQLEVDKIPLTVVCENPSSEEFIIIDNLQLIAQTLKKNIDEICDFFQDKNAILKHEESKISAKITRCIKAKEEYTPYTKIFSFPESFMFLIPAWDSLEIMKRIIGEYEKEFSKVIDRLPLHLGIVFFHRKMPLFSAMDAGKRILKAFEKQGIDTEAQILNVSNSSQGKTQIIIEAEEFKNQAFTWEIDTQTRDPCVKD